MADTNQYRLKRTQPKPMRYGPFREDGSLDGRIIRIGGRDETIPVWLKNGDVEYHCNVRGEDVARRLAPYYLNGTVRLHGSGKWLRDRGRRVERQRGLLR